MNDATTPATGVRADAEILAELRHAYAEDDVLDADRIDSWSDAGLVTLSGLVRDATERVRAERLARAIPGVAQVINRITVLPEGFR